MIEELISDELTDRSVSGGVLPKSVLHANEEQCNINDHHNCLKSHFDTVDSLEIEFFVDKISHIFIGLDIKPFNDTFTNEVICVEITEEFESQLEVEWEFIWEQDKNIHCIDDLEFRNERRHNDSN